MDRLSMLRAKRIWDRKRILKVRKERDALRAERDALAAWSCVRCSARFPAPIDPMELEGVTTCSSCAQIQALNGLIREART